jgi:hypothetical protein
MNNNWHNWHNWGHLGKPAGWSHLHHVATGKNLDGRLAVFAVSTDGLLWQIWQTVANDGWSHWESRGKPTVEGIELTSPAFGKSVAVGRHQDGRLEVAVIASGELWRIGQTAPDNGWGEWQRLGQPHGSGGLVALDLAQNLDGRLQVFALGFIGRLASLSQSAPNGDWGEWDHNFPRDPTIPLISFVAGQNEDGRLELIANLSGILALVTQDEPGGAFRSGFGNTGISTPNSIGMLTMARNPDGTLEAATTIDEHLVHIRQHVPNQLPSPGGGGWARHNLERPAEHIAIRCPILVPDRHGNLTVFVQGMDGNLWHRWQTAPNDNWSEWHRLGSPPDIGEGFRSLDVGQNQDGRLEAFIVHRGELWHTWQTE